MTARCLRYDVSSSTFEEEEYDQGGPERISLDFRLPAGGTRNAALYHLLSRDIPWLRPVRDLDPEGFWLLDLSALRRFKVFGPVPWMAGVANSRPITYPRDNGEWTIRFELSRAELAWLGRQADFRDLKPALDRFHDAFETSEHLAFIITPFVGSGLYASASDAIRNTLESVGLRGLRADDKALADDLLTNVRAYTHGCGLGVAVCGGETSDQVNRNVSTRSAT